MILLSYSELVIQMCAIQQWDWSQWHHVVVVVMNLVAEFFFAFVMMKTKTSYSPFSPVCLCNNWGISLVAEQLLCTWFQRLQIFTFLASTFPKPTVFLLVKGHWYKIKFCGANWENRRIFIHNCDWHQGDWYGQLYMGPGGISFALRSGATSTTFIFSA